MNDPLITFADAARLVGPDITARTLRTWHDKGVLRAIKVGRSWRTTATELEVAIALLWQHSSSTVRTPASEPSPSPACAPMSGTSHGTKAGSALSEALAASLVYELTRKNGQKPRLELKPSSAGSSSPGGKPKGPSGHVIRLR